MNIFEEKEQGIVFSLDSMSKSVIGSISDKIISNVKNGNSDPLKEYIKAKGLSELSDAIVSGIKDYAIDEAEKYGNDQVLLGCKFQLKNLADTYDFSDDDEWNKLNKSLNEIKEKMKAREKQMITAMEYAEIVDENGEVIPAAKIKKRGSKTIAITIPK